MIEGFGGSRVLVTGASAGLGTALPAMGYVDALPYDSIDAAVDVNIKAPIHLAKAALPQMRERGSGQLVFVSSLMGKIPSPAGGIYCSTKSAIRTFASSLRQDLS